MHSQSISDKIIKLNRNIRFAGILNKSGEVIEGGFRQGVEPMLNGTDEQQLYLHSLSNLVTLEAFEQRLGSVRYSLAVLEKVTLLTVPLGDRFLCISAMPKADIGKIRSSVVKAIRGTRNESRPKLGKTKRNKRTKKGPGNSNRL
jgi:hypothetical protein